jgi:hypothetical protein
MGKGNMIRELTIVMQRTSLQRLLLCVLVRDLLNTPLNNGGVAASYNNHRACENNSIARDLPKRYNIEMTNFA